MPQHDSDKATDMVRIAILDDYQNVALELAGAHSASMSVRGAVDPSSRLHPWRSSALQRSAGPFE
jgi:hypothetical protein